MISKKMLKDKSWIVHIKYLYGHESELKISMMTAPDILTALAAAYRHIRDQPEAEILSIKQS